MDHLFRDREIHPPFHTVDVEPTVRLEQYEQLVRAQLSLLGENPDRDGLRKTPSRVAHAMSFLTAGYYTEPQAILNGALFEAESDEMVVVRDIDFYSLCEHHLLPFFGKCHIAYLPERKGIGLSKLPRIVDLYARRLQIQERMTHEIACAVQQLTGAQGVRVVVEAQHLCMMMRGVQKQNSFAMTSAMRGRFRDDARTRSDFLGF